MLGVFVNAISVLILGFLGTKVGKYFSDRLKNDIMRFLALLILVAGIKSASKGQSLVIIISIVFGVIIGYHFDLDGKFNKFAYFLSDILLKNKRSNFPKAFINATLILCVGSMGIIGSIEAGINSNNEILLLKSMIDGLTVFFMAQSLGIGVAFASIPIIVYQGLIVIISGFISPILTKDVIDNISGVGGLSIMAIGLSMLDLADIKIVNSVPSILFPIIYGFILMFL
ncbi:DUF554 domain-containing protein [Anaerococcus senegalensis]|uniref:DUF554 domain-containing protein n=1 Tax=Anaerococcus senegalensis TaxID=1288120 RepID=UPI0002FD61D5|nr:DUF554 domain-containing protein [Anaerococcus senegalensis]MDU3153375.1 DUF554 domain-containing protein [Anaerococcus hydrogenalis]MDU3199198.1 DUF554 domain-containing protein [Anaerococcus hydrogenalis]